MHAVYMIQHFYYNVMCCKYYVSLQESTTVNVQARDTYIYTIYNYTVHAYAHYKEKKSYNTSNLQALESIYKGFSLEKRK